MILSMSGFDTTTGMKYNRVASEYASYLRRYFRYQENKIYGPVIIIGDNEDMNEEKHEILKRMIELKKQNNRKGCNNKSYLKFANETADGVMERFVGTSTVPCNIKTGNFSLPSNIKIGNFAQGGLFPGATKIMFGSQEFIMARKNIALNFKKVVKDMRDEEKREEEMNNTANMIAMALRGGVRAVGVLNR